MEESGESTEERRLVHGDLLLNTLVSEGGISGLLDWGCSVYGDFLYDHAWIAFWSPWYPSMKSFDIVADTKLHLKNVGADIENFDSRMRCCLIHIGLDGQAYNAFTGDWESLEMTANRTSEVATWGCLG
ncbi:MAG: phosphotransferase [Acidimicrobiales bacterium]